MCAQLLLPHYKVVLHIYDQEAIDPTTTPLCQLQRHSCCSSNCKTRKVETPIQRKNDTATQALARDSAGEQFWRGEGRKKVHEFFRQSEGTQPLVGYIATTPNNLTSAVLDALWYVTLEYWCGMWRGVLGCGGCGCVVWCWPWFGVVLCDCVIQCVMRCGVLCCRGWWMAEVYCRVVWREVVTFLVHEHEHQHQHQHHKKMK
jgi:hypothetical protein